MDAPQPECVHRFEHYWRSPFVETSGARACPLCERIEVLIGQRWIAFEDYLRNRRRPPIAAE